MHDLIKYIFPNPVYSGRQLEYCGTETSLAMAIVVHHLVEREKKNSGRLILYLQVVGQLCSTASMAHNLQQCRVIIEKAISVGGQVRFPTQFFLT